jgi:regulatory protein
MYIHHRRQKGYGPHRIQMELASRGIPQDMIEHNLNINDNAWFYCVRKAWQKRFKGVVPPDLKTRAAQFRFLHYRGFTQDQIDKLFSSDNEHA